MLCGAVMLWRSPAMRLSQMDAVKAESYPEGDTLPSSRDTA